ncbi:unnamed protein product [Calicophoron daubneyi]|uniref:PDZ domain-containing protein n=1 Tax=Calicophoron daubneyi TaxID=300641 RepID=A0AAV2TNZ4_CALDB
MSDEEPNENKSDKEGSDNDEIHMESEADKSTKSAKSEPESSETEEVSTTEGRPSEQTPKGKESKETTEKSQKSESVNMFPRTKEEMKSENKGGMENVVEGEELSKNKESKVEKPQAEEADLGKTKKGTPQADETKDSDKSPGELKLDANSDNQIRSEEEGDESSTTGGEERSRSQNEEKSNEKISEEIEQAPQKTEETIDLHPAEGAKATEIVESEEEAAPVENPEQPVFTNGPSTIYQDKIDDTSIAKPKTDDRKIFIPTVSPAVIAEINKMRNYDLRTAVEKPRESEAKTIPELHNFAMQKDDTPAVDSEVYVEAEECSVQEKIQRFQQSAPPPTPPLPVPQQTPYEDSISYQRNKQFSPIQDKVAEAPKYQSKEALTLGEVRPNFPTTSSHVFTSQSRVVLNAVPAMNLQMKQVNSSPSSEEYVSADRPDYSKKETAMYSQPSAPSRALYQQHMYPEPKIHKAVTSMRHIQTENKPFQPPQPTDSQQSRMQLGMLNPNAIPSSPIVNPVRKTGTGAPYIGSQIIAEHTGPSLTVLLRRPNSERQWGFTFYGGAEYGCPPFVNKVTKNGLAFQYGVEVGDVLVSICKEVTVGKTNEQLRAEILRAGNELDLILIRRGIDMEKLMQVAPKVISTPSTEAQSIPAGRLENAPGGGRTFRSVKTRSLRILEEQLAAGETPGSVLITKQHHRDSRGLPVSGAESSFTRAYGQPEYAGYAGRSSYAQPSFSSSSTPVMSRINSPQVVQQTSGQYPRSQYEATHWYQPNPPVVTWDTRTYTDRSSTISSYSQPSYTPQGYAGQGYPQSSPRMESTTTVVPIRGGRRQEYSYF